MRERLPKTWPEIGSVMSNMDHEIDYDIKKLLDQGKCWATYPAWNFYGYVWKHSKGYSCEVWQYKAYQKTFHGTDLEDIMNQASSEYGNG